MNKPLCAALFVFATAFTTSLHAQDVVAGAITTQSSFVYAAALTSINLDSPVNADGQLTSLTVRFDHTASGCTRAGAFRFRVFRRDGAGGFDLVAERGPFDTGEGFKTLPLNPPVDVLAGDFIALAASGSGDCYVSGSYGTEHNELDVAGDFKGGTPATLYYAPGVTMNFRASSAALALTGTLPAVGITAGAAGSSFNTTLAVANGADVPINVRLVYRSASGSHGVADPAFSMTLPAHGSKTLPLADAFAVTGIGSIDVYSDFGAPVTTARIFNDGGNGTNGFTETTVAPNAIARRGDHLFLNIPADLNAFRMNMGFRTFADGAAVLCQATNSAGGVEAVTSRTIPPNTTSLSSLQAFFDGAAPANTPGGTVVCAVSPLGEHSGIVMYGTVTDNRTNDSAFFPAERR